MACRVVLRRVVIGLLVCCFLLTFVEGNIHRAVHTRKKAKEPDGFFARVYSKTKSAWLSIPAALLVGCTGIFPLLIFPSEAGKSLREGVSSQKLQILLSFAVGGLLGDVFLHLLPEAWMYLGKGGHDHYGHMCVGLWVIGGLLSFLILEKVFGADEKENDESQTEKEKPQISKEKEAVAIDQIKNTDGLTQVSHKNGYTISNGDLKHRKSAEHTNGHVIGNGVVNGIANGVANGHISNGIANGHVGDHHTSEDKKDKSDKNEPQEHIKVIGYLNLLANCIDNFTHGLAVSGSFLVSTKVGMCTTFAILLHEIPHEVGDFAILLKSGFRRWDAAVGQMVTASGGVIGAIFGILAEGAGDTTAWVLPWTSGGFIYIALVTVVPDLLKETNPWESIKQLVALLAGIAAMGLVTLFHHQ